MIHLCLASPFHSLGTMPWSCSPASLHAQVTSLVILLFSLSVFAASTYRTIDDTYGDDVTGVMPVYGSNWNAQPECIGCQVQPDPNSAYRGTWHDTTSNHPNSTTGHSMTLQFTGTSIWVYCILTNSGAPYVTIATNASFELDGSQVGIYSHLPDSTAQQYEYNVTVFSMTGLNNVGHTLVINATQGSQASLILFDWAMYMYEDSETTSSSSTSTSQLTSAPSSAIPASTITSTSSSPGPADLFPSGSQTPGTSSGPSGAAKPGTTKPDSSGEQSTGTAKTSGLTSGAATSTSGGTPGNPSGTNAVATQHKGTPIDAIIGGIVGGLSFVALVVCLAIYCRRRRTHQSVETTGYGTVEPLVSPPSFNGAGAVSAPKSQERNTSTLSTASISNTAMPLPTTGSSSLAALAGSADTSFPDDKRAEDIPSSRRGSLTRQHQKLMQKVAIFRAGRSVGVCRPDGASAPAGVGAASSLLPPVPRTAALATEVVSPTRTVPAPSSSEPADTDDDELGRQLASMQVERARLLRAVVGGDHIISIGPVESFDYSEPPPAYATS